MNLIRYLVERINQIDHTSIGGDGTQVYSISDLSAE
jgi:hypothetical protein